MSIEIKMPALSPTMEEGTLAKWLVKEGDTVKSGDLMAEIETDKATMEFEAVDEGVIGKIMVPEGAENVKVGTVIAVLVEEGEDVSSAATPTPAPAEAAAPAPKVEAAPAEDIKARPSVRRVAADGTIRSENVAGPVSEPAKAGTVAPAAPAAEGDRVKASPLARRIADEKGVDLAAVSGSGPNGRIVKADVEGSGPAAPASAAAPAAAPAAPATPEPRPVATPAAAPQIWYDESIPHEAEKLSSIRKVIARRLTESKQTIPHIYLTVDIRLDALLKLRANSTRRSNRVA